MMLRTRQVVIASLATFALAAPLVGADSVGKCDSGGAPALGRIEISPTDDPSATFYVDDRDLPLGNGLWTYQESNGVFVGGDVTKDLQRGGSSAYVPGDNEICTDLGPWAADTLIE